MLRGETDWQSLISRAAVELFARSGRLPPFRLARGDLIGLIAEIAKVDREGVASDIAEAESGGFVALRCLVRCDPLDRMVVVNEWVKPPALAMAQAARRVNADIIRAERENP